MRASWIRVGPEPSKAGVLVAEGNLDPQGGHGRRRQSAGRGEELRGFRAAPGPRKGPGRILP